LSAEMVDLQFDSYELKKLKEYKQEELVSIDNELRTCFCFVLLL